MPAGVSLLDGDKAVATLFAPVKDQKLLGLAVSGGADSLAMLVLAQRWANPRNIKLIVYSVDHGLRPEARAEVAMVLAVAQDLGVLARGLVWTGPHPKTGLQEAARNARYRLIGVAMKDDGVKVLLTAHHRTDQAETVLMRMAHGSGIEGLRGMGAFSDVAGVRIFRPLLKVDPVALRAVVTSVGLTPAEDPSNGDAHYERVRWRKVLPQLAELGLDARRLGEFADRMGQAHEAIAGAVVAALAQIVSRQGSGSALIDRQGLVALPPAVAIALLSQVLASAGAGKKSRAIGAVEALYAALMDEADFGGRTLHGCMVRRAATQISIAPEPGRRAKTIPAVSTGPGPL